MNPQAMTLEQIREEGLAALRQPLGIVGMVRFLQQSEMGWGTSTAERDQWLGDPDLELGDLRRLTFEREDPPHQLFAILHTTPPNNADSDQRITLGPPSSRRFAPCRS